VATIIGLTGGIGSGKSTVAAMLADLGAVVIDADNLAHEIYEPGTEGFHMVVERFGGGVVGEDGRVDRQKLGGRVFGDKKALEDLNAIVHPLVRREVAHRITQAFTADTEAIVVIEAALMVETGWGGGAGELWVVIADRELAEQRLVTLRGMEADEVVRRMAVQTDDETRRKVASCVIENDGTMEDLEVSVGRAWRDLQATLEAAAAAAE
jgi:dephospho-CoA kinase